MKGTWQKNYWFCTLDFPFSTVQMHLRKCIFLGHSSKNIWFFYLCCFSLFFKKILFLSRSPFLKKNKQVFRVKKNTSKSINQTAVTIVNRQKNAVKLKKKENFYWDRLQTSLLNLDRNWRISFILFHFSAFLLAFMHFSSVLAVLSHFSSVLSHFELFLSQFYLILAQFYLILNSFLADF